MSILATKCIDDLYNLVVATGKLPKGKVRSVFSESDLLDRSKLLDPPFAGIMYEGLRANSGDPGRMGRATDCYVSVILGCSTKAIGGYDSRPMAIEILDSIRDSILTVTAPPKHKWRFLSELYVGDVSNVMIYIQRWSTPYILHK